MKLSIQNLFEFLFPLLVCSLYLPPVFYTLFTSSLVVLAIVALAKGHPVNLKQTTPWLFIGFFAVHLTGFLFSDDYSSVWKALQNKLSFVLLPFILMVFQPFLTRSFFRKLIAVFFYSSVLITVVFILISVNDLYDHYNLLAERNRLGKLKIMRPFYSSFLTHGYIHRSYFGLLIGIALFSSPFLFPIKRGKQILFSLAATLLFVTQILLQNRMIIVAFILCSMLYLIIKVIKAKSFKWAIYFSLAVITIVSIAYSLKDSPYNRFNTAGFDDYNLSDNKREFTGTTIRLAIWENSLDIIKEHPLFGVGYGELNEKRLEVYRDNGFEVGLDNEFNSHNQILETQVVAGIPGTIFLLAMFISIWWIAFKRRDTHLFIITSFLFLSMLTEAMFERQLAISIFCTYILAMAIGEKVAFKKEEPA